MDNNQPTQNIEQPIAPAEMPQAPEPPAQTFTSTPEPEPAKKSNKALIAVIVLAVLAIAGVGVGVYYYMDQQLKTSKSDSDKTIATLNTEVATLKEEASKLSTGSGPMTDVDTINYLTINKLGKPSTTTITEAYAPIVKAQDSEWAVSYVITVKYDENTGWSVPAMGYSQVLWRKVDGVWTEIGRQSDTGLWSKEVQALFNEIPETIIPASNRETSGA